MTEIEKIIEKLQVDKETTINGSSPNKEMILKGIDDAISKLNNLSSEYLIESIPSDARLLNSAKKCLKDNTLIDKIFGPEMNARFCQVFGAFIDIAMPNIGIHAAKNLASLLIWSIARKANNELKSKDYKSLVFRAYIITLMIDLEPGSKESVHYMQTTLFPLILEFAKNESIVKLVTDTNNIMYNSVKITG